jgi:hypothetical protein
MCAGQPSDGPMGISVALSPAITTVTTVSKSMITNASFRTKKLPGKQWSLFFNSGMQAVFSYCYVFHFGIWIELHFTWSAYTEMISCAFLVISNDIKKMLCQKGSTFA